MNKLNWVDSIKAICMIAVYLLHSETYYGTAGVSYGYAVQPFYVNAFFFVSGYLFFRKYLNLKMLTNTNGGGYWYALKNVFFRLIIPTLLFSTIIYLPKVLFHSGTATWKDYFFDVFGGISYWFTSALVVAQIILLTLLLFRQTHIVFYLGVTFLLAGLGMHLNLERMSSTAVAFFPWFYKTGLVYTFVMALGGFYYRYESKIDNMLQYGWIVFTFFYVWIIFSTWELHSIKVIGLGGVCNFIGFISMICGIGLLVLLAKQLRYYKWLEFIGRNSIVFYFFSGVMPALWGTVANRFILEKSYMVTFIVATISVLCSYCLTWIIVKYLPFFTDLRKLKSK